MKKIIKIIELIDMISNGSEEMPFEVIYNKNKYKWDSEMGDYRKNGCGECLFMKAIFSYDEHKHNSFYNMIYDEVEIIEEVEDKEYEDIEEFKEYRLIDTKDILELEMLINKINADYNYKINQLIKNQELIIEKIRITNDIHNYIYNSNFYNIVYYSWRY